MGVAGGFEDDVIIKRKLATEGVERFGGQIDPTGRSHSALVQKRHLGKRAVDV